MSQEIIASEAAEADAIMSAVLRYFSISAAGGGEAVETSILSALSTYFQD